VFALALLSGGSPRSAISEELSRDPRTPRDEYARVAAIVRQVNPYLSESEAVQIGRAVLRSSERFDLDPELVTAVLLVESGGRPWARSPKGAIGLMQVMPHMVSGMQLAGNLTTIESNIEAGCSILAANIRRLGEADGISAYFWGSEIRGVAYLDRVRAARAAVRRFSES
jgi:soluble lytic murein transglycosylase-like protein